jgi:hypothetical protein
VIKYDFIVKKGANINLIQLHYNNTNGIDIINDDLVIKTSVGNVIENKPIAYQLINGKQKIVLCNYVLLHDNTIGFNCPDGYNKNYDLIIDPVVVVASFSGSTTWARGSAATYDESGNIYNIGVTGASNYPTTVGAFQNTINGSDWDFIISAYNNTGSVKLFSTFLGGDTLDYPINMVVRNKVITIFGYSNSKTFPVTSNAYDTTYNGKVDFVISKLNITGTNLLASTYVGGLGNEYAATFGVNFSSGTGYHFDICPSGEMVCDSAGNVYIHSSTASLDFPVTSSAISLTRKGIVDACVFKLNSTLSNLDWSTYLGGSGREQGNAIRIGRTGGVYCFGSTTSTNFPVTPGCYQSTKMPVASSSDFYICHINPTGTSIVASTFVGNTGDDIAGLIDIDQNNDIFICGNTYASPSFSSTPGVYSNPNGKNVIYKLNSSLSSSYFKTKFGSVIYAPSIDPFLNFSAFRVDSCQKIYLAGYSDNSLPTTSNAFQPYGGGNTDIYMAIFNPNCSSLFFGSYYGGADTSKYYGEQTEGGISYFDNKGVLYQAVSSSGAMPTTANAYSNSFNILTPAQQGYYDNFNDAFLKVDFQTFVNASSSYGANIIGCQPFNAQFTSFPNTGTISWDFGDGSHSNQSSISHSYPNLGTYDIVLVVKDSTTCNRVDSIKSTLYVIEPVNLNLGEDKFICENSSITLSSNINTITYLWNTGETTPSIIVNQPGNYSLILNNGGCSSTDDINIIYSESNLRKDFPNVITPNNDKINDAIDFSIYNLETIEFIVFDRWGIEKYKTSDTLSKWTPNNFEDGTYFYVLNYIPKCSQDLKKLQGFISVFK